MTQDFARDLDAVLKATRALEPFAFSRYGDGEWAIVTKSHEDPRGFAPHGIGSATEDWTSDRVSDRFRRDLTASMHEVDQSYVVGIICPGCKKHCSEELRARTTVPLAQQSYAELFTGANWRPFIDSKVYEGACLVGSAAACEIGVPTSAVNVAWASDVAVDAMLEVRARPILVAAGPYANVLIHRYWRRQDPRLRVPCIDVGSALDPIIHGTRSRHYQNPKHWKSSRVCSWDGSTVREERKKQRAMAARMR